MRIPQEAFPLTWPEGWPKPPTRERAKFTAKEKVASTITQGQFYYRNKRRTIEQARTELFRELGLLGADRVVLSSNLRLRLDGMPISGQAQPQDPSVAVYFMRDGKPYVFACGKWDRVEDNIWAIALHIGSIRGQDRWGVGNLERAFTGYKALPEKAGGMSWWEILEINITASEEQVREAYVRLAKKYHPDGGSAPNEELFKVVTEAYKMATAHKVTVAKP